MAKKEIALEIKIEAANSAKTLGEMKRSLKELVAEQQNVTRGTPEWKKLANAINDTEGRIGDLQDSFRTLSGSGIERANTSLGLLREGFTNLDFEKVKIGLGGLKTALAATGITLLVQGVMSLIENFDELKNSSGAIGAIFRGIGDIIDWVVEKVNVFADAIGLIDKDLDDMGEAIKTNMEKGKEALDAQTAAFDRQIKVAQAAGKSTVELEKAKQKAIVDTNLAVVKQIEAFVRAGGVLDDEKKKLLTASLEAIRNAKTEENVIEIKAETEKNKAKEEAYKKHQEQLRQIRKDAQKAMLDGEAEEMANLQEFNKMLADEEKAKRDKEIAEQMAADDAMFAAFKKRKDDEAKYEEEQRKKAEEDFKRSEDAKVEAQRVGLDAARGLSEAFFAFQLNKANGNAAKELEIRKRMFAVDKAFNVARAIQDGIRSVQAALTIPPPGGQILAGVNATLAAANVAKILATKFDAGGASAANISVPTAGNTNVPQINNASNAAPIQPTTTFNEQGQNMNMNVKAYVVQSDIDEGLEKSDKMKRLREF